MITVSDYFMGRDVSHRPELTDEIIQHAHVTVQRANMLLSRFYSAYPHVERRYVTSGWRPPAINQATPGAAVRSKHLTGEAVDLTDYDGALDEWCMDHPDILESCGLWMEHPAATKGWCHLQIVPPRSGRRIFYP